MRCNWLLILLAGLVPTLPAFAQSNPSLASRIEQRDGKEKIENLAISRFDLSVEVQGASAITTMTANFINAGKFEVEGEFTFDLPAGAVVTGYALDVNGMLVDGVLMEGMKARRVYEDIVRRGIDPGLAQVSQANRFSTRVYPVLPGKGRTIRVKFVTPLDPIRPFVLPLAIATPIATGSIRVRIDGTAQRPRLSMPRGIEAGLTQMTGGWEAARAFAKMSLNGALSLGPVVPVRKLQISRHRSGQAFFDIQDSLPAMAAQSRGARLRLYWDTSRSRRSQNLSAEIALASRYAGARQAAAIDIVFFADGAPVLKTVQSPKDMEAVLRAAAYRGATSFTGLREMTLPAADACMLFSDGNLSLDPWSPQAMPCPVMTVSSAKDTNRGLLRTLARASGGEFIDVSAVDAATAFNRLITHRGAGVTVTDNNGNAIDYHSIAINGAHMRLIGPLPQTGDIHVKFAREVKPRRYAVPRNAIAPGDASAGLWAAQQIEAMGASDRADENALLKTARQFNVAKPGTSFVVYETADDYATAEIEPPALFGKKFVSEYYRELARQERNAQEDKANRLERILRQWDQQKTWWKTDFTPKPEPSSHGTVPAPSPAMAGSGGGGGSGVEQVMVSSSRLIPSFEITMTPWNPKRPYLEALGSATGDGFWQVFREQEIKHGETPAFYLDVAEYLSRKDRQKDAVLVLLNALDLPVTDVETMVIVADRLMRYGDKQRAVWLHERIMRLEAYRPQPMRNLALALTSNAQKAEDSGRQAEARADYARALQLLSDVVLTHWDYDFDGIEVISLMEANVIIPKLRRLGETDIKLDPRLIALLDVDLRVVLEWNTDTTDMDLWVDEPGGERAKYSNPRTRIGGRLSNDMTNGYGPEEYLLRKAPDGAYTVRANVYGTDQLNPNGAITIRATVFRDYGRPSEEKQVLELELTKADEAVQLIGTIKVDRGE